MAAEDTFHAQYDVPAPATETSQNIEKSQDSDDLEIPKEAFYAAGFELWKRDGGSEFVDPLTNWPMADPVIAEDGITYERKSITTWFDDCGETPVSPILFTGAKRTVLSSKELTPNTELREQIKKREQIFSAIQEPVAVEESAAPTNIVTIRELNHIFAHLDPVRDVLDRTLVGWEQPQIVVVGQESSGKSTLLERISMMSIFPRLLDDTTDADGQQTSTCTRIRIELQLRNSVEQHIPELQVVYSKKPRQPIPGFEKPMLVPAHNGHIDVRREMNKLLAGVQGGTSDDYIADRIITLRVSGPQVPSIDLVDLPGIRQTGKGAESTKSIVSQHIETYGDRSLVLFVMRAGEVRANYSALAVAETHRDAVLTNSIGVLTMLDMLSPKAIAKSMKQVMTGEENLFKRYGWVATMNGPPDVEEEVTEATSGFKQLLEQARREVEFFKGIAWENREQLTTNHLIGHLNMMFTHYLKETWMPGAMIKLLASLELIDYNRFKLGIVQDSPLSKKDISAAKEVERRLRAIMKPMRDSFNVEVLVCLCKEVAAYLASQRLTAIKNEDVQSILAGLDRDIKVIVAAAIAKISTFWTDKIYETLTTETKEDSSGGEGTFSLNTYVSGLCMSVPVVGAMANRMMLFAHAKKMTNSAAAFIQLSHYPDYTDQIKANCESFLADFQLRVTKNVALVVQRAFVDCDSPWFVIEFDVNCEMVEIKVGASAFGNALIAAFVREYPKDQIFLNLHEGAALGSERADARAQLEQLNKEYSDVNRAVSAIKEAFDIKQDEEDRMKKNLVF